MLFVRRDHNIGLVNKMLSVQKAYSLVYYEECGGHFVRTVFLYNEVAQYKYQPCLMASQGGYKQARMAV